MNVAQITWSQIPVMTKMACGARNASYNKEGKLSFKVTNKPYRFVEVVLAGDDTYSVEYIRIKRGSLERVSLERSQGIYADMLGECIYHMVNK